MSKTLAPKPKQVVDDAYMDLIKEFPLRPIRTEKEHTAAQVILDRLVGRPDLSPGQSDYLAGLVHFVEDFERKRYADQFEEMSSIEILKHLMEENDMNTSDLGHILGSRGLASEVLSGKRGLSKMLIAKLSQRFALSPSLFLDVDEAA